MNSYWPWLLIVVACPLMMWFMMGGMGRRDGGGVVPPAQSGPPTEAMPPAGDEQARITQLEGEVAELRAARDRPPGEAAAPRR